MTKHDELIERATKAYLGWCRANDSVEQQPNKACSHVQGDTVVLANQRGTLARYRLNYGRLVKLEDEEEKEDEPARKFFRQVINAMYRKLKWCYVPDEWIMRAISLRGNGLTVKEAVDATVEKMKEQGAIE